MNLKNIRLCGGYKYEMPQMPNFVRTTVPNLTLDVKDIADSDLKKIGKTWTKALLEHAAKRRGDPAPK